MSFEVISEPPRQREMSPDISGRLTAQNRSMLLYHRTSLLTSKAQTIVNTVNCVGVMGKGIAAEFRKRYPRMYEEYKVICEGGELKPGNLWLWHGPDHLVLNFATKNHWRSPSKIEWIERGLRAFRNEYDKLGIAEASFPRLGCGNGGLNWDDVRPLMEHYLADLPIPIFIHDYEANIGLPEHTDEKAWPAMDTQIYSSLDDFSSLLREAIEHYQGCFSGLASKEPFYLREDAGNFVLSSKHGDAVLDRDDVRAVWVAALSGLVTRANLVAHRPADVDLLLGLVRALPATRVVQIQRLDSSEPEIAVETKHSPRSSEFGIDAFSSTQRDLFA